jgi:hypothetical protein
MERGLSRSARAKEARVRMVETLVVWREIPVARSHREQAGESASLDVWRGSYFWRAELTTTVARWERFPPGSETVE